MSDTSSSEQFDQGKHQGRLNAIMNEVEHLVREVGMVPNSATERLNAFQLITPDVGVYVSIEVAVMLSSYSDDESASHE